MGTAQQQSYYALGKKNEKEGVQHRNESLVTVTALHIVTAFSGRGEKIYDKHLLPTDS